MSNPRRIGVEAGAVNIANKVVARADFLSVFFVQLREAIRAKDFGLL